MLSCEELDAKIREEPSSSSMVDILNYTFADAETEKISLAPFETFSEFNPLFDRYYHRCRENRTGGFFTRMFMCDQFSYAIPTVTVLREIISFCGNTFNIIKILIIS